jgi:hypothetical protein
MVFHADYEDSIPSETIEICVGDLVQVRGAQWIGRKLGVVTRVKELVHDQTNEKYIAVTALVGENEYTFSHMDFELVSRAEKKLT